MSRTRFDGKPPIRFGSRSAQGQFPCPYFLQIASRSLTKSKEVADEELVMAAGSAELIATSGLIFERGRLYDLYSARRNERLRRKRGEAVDEKKNGFGLGVTVECSKRKDGKKLESLRRSVCNAYSAVERNETPAAPRCLMRSSVKSIGVRRAKKY